MKKPLVTVSFIIIFCGMLASQIGYEYLSLSANTSKSSGNIEHHYEKKLKKAKFQDIKGKIHDFSKIKTPVIIFNFWASWCQPCIEEFPSLVELRKKYRPDQVAIIGINSDDEDAMKKIKRTIKKHGLNFTIVDDSTGNISRDFKVSAIPVSIIFHNGKVVEISNGAKDFTSVESINHFNKWLQQ